MRRRIRVLMMVAGSLVGGGGLAFASSGTPAQACLPAYGGLALYMAPGGVENPNASNEAIVCPVYEGTFSGNNQTVSSGWLNYYDGTTSASLYCWMFLSDTNGSVWWSANTNYDCSTGGGCSSANNAYTGTNYLGWSGSNLPTGGSFTEYSNDEVGFYCNLPSSYGAEIFAYGVN